MKQGMDVHFHGEREGSMWRGQVIGAKTGELKARTTLTYFTQGEAITAARNEWRALQQQLQAVTS